MDLTSPPHDRMTRDLTVSTYCLTFGDQFRSEEHPTFPAAHPDGWVEVEADDYSHAVRIGYALFGGKWASAYPRHLIQEQFFPRGCLAVFDSRGVSVQSDAPSASDPQVSP